MKRTICKVKGCKNPVRARGWCSAHHNRWNRYGSPTAGSTLVGAPHNFLREVIFKYDGESCLIWPFSLRGGYPRLCVDGKSVPVSRFICEHFYGPPPTPEHEAAHSCKKNKACVNRRHLRWATPIENAADTLIHKTRIRGENHYCAKLTEKEVRRIKKLKNKKRQSDIAKEFGVTSQVIYNIHSGRSWVWLS